MAARDTGDMVVLNMAGFPEFRYAQGQALTYEWLEKKHPALFEKIKVEIQAGKWEVTGGTWVEPAGNLISGESWVRQILYGKNYFKDKFGIDVKTAWQAKPSGTHWNMPQIYQKSGIDRLVTRQLSHNDTTVFPYHIFRWQGVDGSSLLSYAPLNAASPQSSIIKNFETNNIAGYEAATGYKKSLLLYGGGDRDNGPYRQTLKRLRKYKKLFIAPEYIHSTSRNFLDNIEKDLGKNIPLRQDELYLENHRGAYTTRSEIKKSGRRGESRISTAEKLAAAAALMGFPYPQKELEDAWKMLLTNQAYPILSGFSSTPVYRDAMELYEKADKTIKKVAANALKHMAQKINTAIIKEGVPLLVFNSLSWRRSDFVTVACPAGFGEELKILDINGGEVPIEIEEDREDGGFKISFIAEDIPPAGYKLFSIAASEKLRKKSNVSYELAQGKTIENKFYKIKIDAYSGNMKSIFAKALNREFVAKGKEANVLRVYEDRPEKWDARNIGYTGRMWELNRADSIDIVTDSPVRVVLRVKKSFLGLTKTRRRPTEYFPSSFFTQYITLYRDLDRVDIKTEADWWEEHMFLKAVFPVNVKSDNAAYEIPFAAINRTTKFDTAWEKARFEAPALKWADLSEAEFGISLLNDCKYGYDIHGYEMMISLLRSPLRPDPLTDRGKHTFVYSLYAHKGRWHEAETVKRGYELNSPLIALITDRHEADFPGELSFFSVTAQGVILDTVKKEEKGSGIILRLYESGGKAEKAALRFFKAPVRIYEAGIMENKIREIKCPGKSLTLSFKKYEIKTLLIYF
jgi:alpha-mannosidase